jgi:type VI secretion system protein ImpG
MFNKYYQDELAYLREMGRDFARIYPEAAHFVGEASQDPDVERLLEGFAFLTARVRQKLEDELPELTHTLLETFFPHYLRPIPSFTLIQFEALPQAAREVRTIQRGVEIDSALVDGTACRFRTGYDVQLQPLVLDNVVLKAEAPPALKLRFRIPEGVDLGKLGLSTIRLHLAGDAVVSRALYLCLCRYLKRITVAGGSSNPFALPKASVRPVGFGTEESLFPVSNGSFPGFRLLTEYFCFPTKFMFVDVAGLEGIAALGKVQTLDLTFELTRLPEAMPPVSTANVMLHCTPALNLFKQDADPIRLNLERVEYRVRPAGRNPDHYEIYSFEKVSAPVKGTGKAREYLPLYRFSRPPGDKSGYYRHRRAVALSGEGSDVFISPIQTGSQDDPAAVETLSIELSCTNRQLPWQLKAGDVSVATSTSPNFARFRNIARPLPSVPPPLTGDLHWKLISHMAVNYMSLISVDALRGILSLYHFRARVDRQAEQALKLLLEGIKKVSSAPVTRLIQGCPVRGVSMDLECEEDNFGGEGEMFFFGTILNEFLAQYVSLNSFCRLSIKGLKYGEIHTWPMRIGERPLL